MTESDLSRYYCCTDTYMKHGKKSVFKFPTLGKF